MKYFGICVIVLFQGLIGSIAKAVAKELKDASCKESIGVQTGFLETRDIKTSTSQKDFTATGPWCATKNDKKQFIAFDLGEDFSISKVATVGKSDDKNRFVSSYTLEYSQDGAKWDEYKDLFGNKELEGNSNTYDVRSNKLTPSLTGRYVKLIPLEWSKGGICTSIDFFGCPVEEQQNDNKKS